ncbi:MAG: citrate synthase [Candidatus Margulisiibacteriota bacterium]
MKNTAKLILDGKEYKLPVIEGSEGEKAIDITALRSNTKYITLDPGYANTGSCTSGITFIDGDKGILRHRGYPIDQLAEKSRFLEVAYLLIYGELPTKKQLEKLSQSSTRHSMIHEDMKNFFNGYPPSAHPMLILSAMTASLCSYYPKLAKPVASKKDIDLIAIELISKVRTISAFSYKKSIGEPFVYPRGDYKYVHNFLHMMFSSPLKEYEYDEDVVKILEMLFILHADHEQNCSTSSVRLVSSSQANLFASISAGICALWGPLHGGANQNVIEMLQKLQADGGDIKKYINMAKDKNDPFRLMGFGHRVYKNYDPRARIIKHQVDKVLKKLGVHDSLLELALQLEEKALKDDYFIERKLFPNIDFYSGIIYRAIGIPLNMFPVMFAIARVPGWIAQWKEMISSPDLKIGRPRQIYTGKNERDYVPIEERR